jgi:hypothetical protein
MRKRFRVAFSFPAEKRPFIAEVARILAGRFGSDRILYDKFHVAEFARSDLAQHLASIYQEQTDLLVVALSPGYDRKEWCGLEWAAIYAGQRRSPSDSVMLCRWDRVEGVGLYGLAGFVELDNRTPDDAANLILERLALQEGQPAGAYASPPSDVDWPEVAPPLEWPVADLHEPRRAFSQLLTRRAPFRVLLVRGASETGKSVFVRQCLRSALKIPGLRCGLVDFKGSASGPAMFSLLAATLDLPEPRGDTVSDRFGKIWMALRRAPRPTLLILDTFELVGEAEQWVKGTLLLQAARTTWLRVVIAGQRIPDQHGEPWTSVCAPSIELARPDAQQWFDYGRQYKPDLTLDFVQQVHAITNGRSAVLAQLLGPVLMP